MSLVNGGKCITMTGVLVHSYFLLPDLWVCKPCTSYIQNSINQVTPRLQCIFIRTFPYHFTVRYIPGLTNQLDHCLSRLGGQKDTIKLPKQQLYQIRSQLSTRSDSLNQLSVAMQEDDVHGFLKHTISQGWLSSIKEVPSELQPY